MVPTSHPTVEMIAGSCILEPEWHWPSPGPVICPECAGRYLQAGAARLGIWHHAHRSVSGYVPTHSVPKLEYNMHDVWEQ